MMKRLLIVFLILLTACAPQERNVDTLEKGTYEVKFEDANYYGLSQGLLAQPIEEGTYPGVIMIHEFWGLNDHIKDTAKLLASEGYVVLAVDLYDGKVASTQDEARASATRVRGNVSTAVANMKAAVEFLKSQPSVDDEKVASLGWCFGGGMSLQLSLNQELAATVIYYGNLETNSSKLSKIMWPVLGIFGEKDTGIPPEQVNAFDSVLDSLNIENEIYIYPGVGHAFANPSGMNYAPKETKDAWDKTLAFLDRNLK